MPAAFIPKNMIRKLVVGSWIFVFGLLFLYSYVQVDLGLTLTRASILLTLEKSFQYIGYFNRPLSTLLYCSIALLLFILYVWTLWLVHKKKLDSKAIWIITILGAVILGFAYNAFSYDLFNYIFDAKVVTYYHQNPYEHKALDYPGDPMLGFMHWTHRTYPYGPVWLGLTIPLSFVGGGIFLVTFFLFKLLMVASYLLCARLIEKIARKTKIIDPVFALAFFSLSPLILIEGLVSAHNEIPMMALTLLGVYFLVRDKNIKGWFALLLSIGIKFATVFLLPLFAWYPFSKNKHRDFIFFLGSILLMSAAVYLASVRTTFQPWYLLFIFPFCAFLAKKFYILIPSVMLSVLVFLQYVPYLYTGSYDKPIPQIMNQMLAWSLLAVIGITVLFGAYKRIKK